MFEDTLELAENKLLLLYLLSKIKLPVSNTQITEIILENNLINYFTLQQYISELTSSNFIKYSNVGGSNRLGVTEKGIKVLDLFKDRISESKCELIDAYLQEHLEKIEKEVTVTADYTIEKTDNFIVNLKAMENDTVLIDLKLIAASNKQARELCARWKSEYTELYSAIINILTDKIS